MYSHILISAQLNILTVQTSENTGVIGHILELQDLYFLCTADFSSDSAVT